MSLLIGAARGNPPWQSLGPAPIAGFEYTGRVSAIACSRTDANRYFVSGADGGVWRTVNGGGTWTALTDHMPTTAIGALAIDPSDGNTIYAGTGESNFAHHSRHGVGVLKSTDGGATWSQLAEPVFAGRCFSRILVHPTTPTTLYAAITPPGGFAPPGSAAKRHPGASGPVGVFRSLDAGMTWTQLGGGLPVVAATDLAMQLNNPLILYAAIGDIFGNSLNGVYKTTNGGTSWTRLAGGLPTANVGRISLAVAPSQPTRVYTAIANACDSVGNNASTLAVMRSDNSGASWTSISPGNYMATYGWYLNVVSVKPNDANTVILGGLTMLRSVNAGAGWTTITPPHVDLHAAEWDASTRLIAGDDGGVHRSADVGNSWSPLNQGLGIIQFYAGLSLHPTDSSGMLAGAQDNGSNQRSGANWSQVLGGDGGYTAINPVTPTTYFAEFQGTGNLYRAQSGGGLVLSNTGINTGDRNCFLPPFDILASNPQRMVYGTHRVYQSTNGGTSWAAISPDLCATPTGAIRAVAIAPGNQQCIWAVTNDGNVQVTFNGGTQWLLRRQNVPGWLRVMRQITVSPESHLRAWLAGSAYGAEQVLYTDDGGASWVVLDGDLPDAPVNTIAADFRPAIDALYAGTEAGVFRSLDGGIHWRRFGAGLPNGPVIDLRLEAARSRLVAATQGRGAWQVPIWLPGDVDGNGVVDSLDVAPLVAVLLEQITSGEVFWRADINGDDVVDGTDIGSFVALIPN